MPQPQQCYYPASESGVEWLINVDDPRMQEIFRQTRDRNKESSCDVEALIADIPHFRAALSERHFGIASSMVDATDAFGLVDAWESRLESALAAGTSLTWGEAVGGLHRDLRRALNDQHSVIRFGEPVPQARPSIEGDDGPAWESRTVAGVRLVRIRALDGDTETYATLQRCSDAHQEDFAQERIIVDLRGNGGGNDAHVYAWAQEHYPQEFTLDATARRWIIGQKGIPTALNYFARSIHENGPEAVPEAIREYAPPISPDTELSIFEEPAEATPAGSTPWHGRMLILVDGGTGSSGESAAIHLSCAFKAPILGVPTFGVIEYGNFVTYFLPNSGLEFGLPSQRSTYPVPIEFVGIQPNIALDPQTPIEYVAENFDSLHGHGGQFANPSNRESVP